MRPFSVIIPSGGPVAGLRLTLASLTEQCGELVEEVIVVRDGATTEPSLVAHGPGVRVLTTGSPRGPAAARNTGAACAAARTLIFLDDDVVLAPDAIVRLAQCLERHPSGAAFVGTIVPHPSVADNAYLRFAYGGAAHAPPAKGGARIAPWLFCTSLCAVHAEDFRRAGCFDEAFRAPGYEDVELGARLADLRITLRTCDAARGLHLRQMDRQWFIARHERLGMPLGRLLTLHPALRSDPESGAASNRLATRLSRRVWPGLLRLLPLIERLPAGAGGSALRFVHAVGVAAGSHRAEDRGGAPPGGTARAGGQGVRTTR